MTARRNYTVDAPAGNLNLREEPSVNAMVITLLPTGSKVKVDTKAKTPNGWKKLESGGFVMDEFLK